jgi:thioredoxin
MAQHATNPDLIQVSSEQQFDTLLESETPLVVDFWAEWCGPCRRLGPLFADQAASFRGEVRFAKVDVERLPALASRYRVRGIPTLLGFAGGKLAFTQVGLPEPAELSQKIGALRPRTEGPGASEASDMPKPGIAARVRRFFGAEA